MTFAAMATPGQSKSPWYAEFAAGGDRDPDQPVKGREGLALSADQRRAGRTEFRAGPPEHGRVLAREDRGRASRIGWVSSWCRVTWNGVP